MITSTKRRSTTPLMRGLGMAGLFLAAVLTFSFSFTPLRTSHDEFWHLKTGRWILSHGLPDTDIFTTTAAQVPWHNHEWLSQVLLWITYSLGEGFGLGGLRAVIALKTAVIVLAFVGFGALLTRGMRQPVWAALAAALAAALGRRTFYPRPPFITYLLLALVFWLLLEWRQGRLRHRRLWALPPIFVLWSNLHGGWLAGLVTVGAFWFDTLWQQLQVKMSGEPVKTPRRRLGFMTLILAACTGATLLNPYTYHLYVLTWRVMAEDPYLARTIGEMMPPDWNFVWVLDGVMMLLLAAAIRPVSLRDFLVAALAVIAYYSFFRLPWDPALLPPVLARPGAWVHAHMALARAAVAMPILFGAALRTGRTGWLAMALTSCFFALQGILHVRHLPLLAIAVMPTLAWALEAWAFWLSRTLARVFYRSDPGDPRVIRLAGFFAGAEALAGLAALLALTPWWLMPLPIKALAATQREWPSYFERNHMLLRGIEMQPVFHDTATADLPTTTSLPAGRYLIEPYPVQAVNFLVRADLPGPLWNGGNYAGYLIWRLSPEKYKVFTDNRYDIYGGLVIREEHSVLEGWDARDLAMILKHDPDHFSGKTPPPWNEVLDGAGAQTVFVPAEARVNGRLAKGGWVRVWEDYAFNIWVRDTPENRPVIDHALELPHPPLPGVIKVLSRS